MSTENNATVNKQYRTIQITAAQYQRLCQIQLDIEQNPRIHGFRPTVHHCARIMLDKGFDQYDIECAKYAHER